MAKVLSDALSKEDGFQSLKAYVLMERIKPKSHTTTFLRRGESKKLEALSEFGIYSAFLSSGPDQILRNDLAGHLVRTKPIGVDEGGVATGFSVLDSPALKN
jgi:hypothetical protein